MPESRPNVKNENNFPFGFHLSRRVWDWLDAGAAAAAIRPGDAGSVLFATRRLAQQFNEKRRGSSHLLQPVHGGELAAIGLINDVLRFVIELYCVDFRPAAVGEALRWTDERRGRVVVDRPPPAFLQLYPPHAVAAGRQKPDEFLADAEKTILFKRAGNDAIFAAEMIVLWLAMSNPAFRPARELFDDQDLRRAAPYQALVESLDQFFAKQPPLPEVGLPLFDALRAPIMASPDSLEGQLQYILTHWASFLPPELLERLHVAANILREEMRRRGFGPGSIEVLRFDAGGLGDTYLYAEPAAFSRDADWMSNVVLIAKTVYVWLDQLSKKYQRHIRLLSDVPDEELDRLGRWGFTGLWLIGVWQRSPASQRIKEIMGNPEAAPSAYSLYDYAIADDLGGEAAYGNLRERAWRRGIRLASDMVPNHMGIYSKWVIEHPDWFLQSPWPPFPGYRYNGENLSHDARVRLQIEDGYWERRDAAVTFVRVDEWTGDRRYIYHGNDGTNMPWNDTAQLNFLLPEVREAVIQTILHVARKFPIIRFDAAMTLAKRHFHRLWFPPAGEGGAIPSRAEHGMTKEQFDAVFPKEFWREVVDRVAAEAPDTLLLAEAFWLMEGYFVRTLGMHRVDNSAFMNMLKMEENLKYRLTVKNVLEFSPEVLKRFVNFMNNPDEETAVAQFGRGDKYFGVAVLMVTMPGLPMFGHGQIEGLTEKYGMEYRRAYWDEAADEEMVRRHENEIFPLMRRRHLFSGAANFAFYDFSRPEGWVDENVFAYSNRADGERGIILYNNAYATTRGWIRMSTPINVGDADEKNLVRRTLGEALALNPDEHIYYVFRNQQNGLEYLRHTRQLSDNGLFAELSGYQYQAFLDFREAYDADGSWGRLAQRLDGRGVPDMFAAHRELHLEPVLGPFRALFNADSLRAFLTDAPDALTRCEEALPIFFAAARDFSGATVDVGELTRATAAELAALAALAARALVISTAAEKSLPSAPFLPALIAWATVRRTCAFFGKSAPADAAFDDWLLGKALAEAFRGTGLDDRAAYFDALLARVLTAHSGLLAGAGAPSAALARGFFTDAAAQQYLQANVYEGRAYINKEQFESALHALALAVDVQAKGANVFDERRAAAARKKAELLAQLAGQANYQVDEIVRLLESKKPAKKGGRKKADAKQTRKG